MGNYDQAVHSAFVLLEERMRLIVGRKGMAGVAMVGNLFAKDGRLTRHMALNEKEQEKYRNLFDSAFSLYRNPAAHTVTNYDVTMGKAIIGLVNLLLLILGDPAQWPPPTDFPENVEKGITLTEQAVGTTVAHRLRLFLTHCVKMGINPTASKAVLWVPFKRPAIQHMEHWNEPRQHLLQLFYLHLEEKKPGLYVPLNQYYTRVVGLNIEPLGAGLRQIGFGRDSATYRDYRISFAEQNSQAFFDEFLAWLKEVVEQLAALEKTI
jgi:hypothetical protein